MTCSRTTVVCETQPSSDASWSHTPGLKTSTSEATLGDIIAAYDILWWFISLPPPPLHSSPLLSSPLLSSPPPLPLRSASLECTRRMTLPVPSLTVLKASLMPSALQNTTIVTHSTSGSSKHSGYANPSSMSTVDSTSRIPSCPRGSCGGLWSRELSADGA